MLELKIFSYVTVLTLISYGVALIDFQKSSLNWKTYTDNSYWGMTFKGLKFLLVAGIIIWALFQFTFFWFTGNLKLIN